MSLYRGVFSPITFPEAEANVGLLCTKSTITDLDGWKAKRSEKNRAKRKRKFKSGSFINTIKSVIIHPILGIPAYTFVEDDSYVECRRCKIIDKFKCSIAQLHTNFDDLVIRLKAKGFSIGNDDTMYDIIKYSSLFNFYYVYQKHNMNLSRLKFIWDYTLKVTVHY